MKEVKKAVESVIFLGDPNEPSRPVAHHVVVASYLDREDGSPLIVLGTRTMNEAQLAAEGIELPQLAQLFVTKATTERDEAIARVEQIAAALSDETDKVTQAKRLNDETTSALSQKMTVLAAAEAHIAGLEAFRTTAQARITELEQQLAAATQPPSE